MIFNLIILHETSVADDRSDVMRCYYNHMHDITTTAICEKQNINYSGTLRHFVRIRSFCEFCAHDNTTGFNGVVWHAYNNIVNIIII